ncbi:tryptophan--tRNA ligase [Candidatus Kaiserbacteria bacterium RIFCSPLOWO2_02_FULL_56_11]|uniref:Tryptophan--tRNA ligase n=1 Tax=Candidatus Kaiserbacteria bacterium RIFCSPHIGHO2_02_FULL_56_30 TaxID=1798499 RepID=A0A1F6E267_9BACT|nr:MAG: tryptophan--tRNA ligase [Candidatus Kaiserbacteria bacterium RIFCSPHIGHO2_02_FULL_56_30]OGG81030.1 MAG: tryptophan--tRNA ligase [Candidatus Kaiserbacteria bacterium RIFCSPLOWO2_02_FULL_56_11]
MFKQTILSGIRATGRLHFGNFMGAVRNFVEFQKPGNRCLYFIADLHTLTTLQNPEELRGNVLEIAKDYLAAGLDPNKSTIYAQSSIPEISELSILLAMVQPLGEIERTPTFKDLVRKNPDNVNLGLVNYPVLMSADILGPQATLVPVGSDQRPNVEVTRNLAKRFNDRYGQTFVIPKMMNEMVKIPGLDGEKMGKSDTDNSIDINAPIDQIRQRYREKGVTDPDRKRRSDPGDPYNGCRSVYPLHELISSGEAESRVIAHQCQRAEIGCADCKDLLVDSIAKILEPFQERRKELADKDVLAREVLHEGGKKARRLIIETTAIVRDKMGIVIY